MKNYIVLDKYTGIVDHTIQWPDDRIIDKDYPLEANQEIVNVDDTLITVKSGDIFNFANGVFNHTTKIPEVGQTELEVVQDRCTNLENVINMLMM